MRHRHVVDRSIAVVCFVFGVGRRDLMSRDRRRHVATARHTAMHLVRKHTGMTLQEIAGAFGFHDHTSVLHATTKIRSIKRETGTEESREFRSLIARAETLYDDPISEAIAVVGKSQEYIFDLVTTALALDPAAMTTAMIEAAQKIIDADAIERSARGLEVKGIGQ